MTEYALYTGTLGIIWFVTALASLVSQLIPSLSPAAHYVMAGVIGLPVAAVIAMLIFNLGSIPVKYFRGEPQYIPNFLLLFGVLALYALLATLPAALAFGQEWLFLLAVTVPVWLVIITVFAVRIAYRIRQERTQRIASQVTGETEA